MKEEYSPLFIPSIDMYSNASSSNSSMNLSFLRKAFQNESDLLAKLKPGVQVYREWINGESGICKQLVIQIESDAVCKLFAKRIKRVHSRVSGLFGTEATCIRRDDQEDEIVYFSSVDQKKAA